MNTFLRLTLIVLSLTFHFKSNAQTLLINLINSNVDSYPISAIRSIKFEDSNMIVNENNGSVTNYAIADILNYAFDLSNAFNDNAIINTDYIHIFPNPSKEAVNISVENMPAQTIKIFITDINGKLIDIIFEGIHTQGKTYQWQPNVKSGKYFCTVVHSDKNTIKSFLID